MIKIRFIANGWSVITSTYRLEGYGQLVADGGYNEKAFTYDTPDDRAACWAKVVEYLTGTAGV